MPRKIIIYSVYAELYEKYGNKIEISINKEILNKLSTQSEILDVVWGSIYRKGLSPRELSEKIMSEIERLAEDVILKHAEFKNYGGDVKKLIKRARDHYKVDERHTGFRDRQDRIKKALSSISPSV